MPISSGAGGRAARLHLPVGASKRTYWPNNVSSNSSSKSRIDTTASSISLINQESLNRLAHLSLAPATKSNSTSNLSSDRENLKKEVPRNVKESKRNRMKITRQQDNKVSSSSQQKLNTIEKYNIRHISRPSSHSTTSKTTFEYFTGDTNASDNEKIGQDRGRQHEDNEPNQPLPKMSSFAGQSVPTGDGRRPTKFSPTRATNAKQGAVNKNYTNCKSSSSLFGSLTALGANHKAHNYQTNNNDTQQSTTTATMKRFGANGSSNLELNAHYSTTATINQHNSQASLNPSMSPAFGIGKGGGGDHHQTTASTSCSTANLHSLSSLHQQPTTISKKINLNHDEFSLVFTSSKLRFSLVNLVLSAIWFIVLTGAILFDIYLILLIGCLVDVASFVLLLACSIIHFTHRIDYNTVSLTSLLLLLFSIIVLHVYLLVIASLTIYLLLAVKRRKKH